MTTKAKNRCTVTLKQNETHLGTFRPPQDIFYEIQKDLGSYKISSEKFNLLMEKIKPFRSLQEQSKKVRCLETGQIFENARAASNWVAFVRENYYCSIDTIRLCCRGCQKTAFGYHWEYIENSL